MCGIYKHGCTCEPPELLDCGCHWEDGILHLKCDTHVEDAAREQLAQELMKEEVK
jgi:hypothetical protein